MTGRILALTFREGGAYRMRLTYNEPEHTPGKTFADADDVEVRYVKLVPDQRIEQAVTFEGEDPAFSGEMRVVWELDATDDGTLVTVRCENVPSGISAVDHQAGLASTLDNLRAFLEGQAK